MHQETSHPLQARFQRYQQQRHGRQQDPIPCVLCRAGVPPRLEVYTEHFQAVHGDVLDSERKAAHDPSVTDAAAVRAIARKYYRRSQNPPDPGQKPDETPSSHAARRGGKGADALPTVPPPVSSPSATGTSTKAVIGRDASPSSHGKTHSSRARRPVSEPDAADFPPRPQNQGGTLWTADTAKRGRKPGARPNRLQQQQQQQQQRHRHGQSPGSRRRDETADSYDNMLRQPDTRPITQQQLIAEVKGIYKGLVLLESKCIEVDTAQSAAQHGNRAPVLNDEQWQALSALHRVLLHEHHDFFLASQHPSASEPLKRLALKYNMPARMWRYGIHSYLEVLRHNLPESRQHMLSYIYLAYDMMALLYETVPSYKETWIECLGDLGRYRMAIEEENVHDRETWTEVSRQWYKKASDLSPETGRLYHHLAILARPNWLQQLLYYSKSLCVPTPFESARESVLTLFEPLIREPGPSPYEAQQQPIDPPLVRCHAGMFMRTGGAQRQRAYAEKFLGLLDNHIARTAGLFLQPAYMIGIANCCAMVEYGSKSNVVLRVISADPDAEEAEEKKEVDDSTSAGGSSRPTEEFLQARALTCDTARLIFNRLGDPNVWPFIHVTMVFIYHLTLFEAKGGMAYVEQTFPWTSLVNLLNTFNTLRPTTPLDVGQSSEPKSEEPLGAAEDVSPPSKYKSETFPGLAADGGPPLPEDFAMRGLIWAERYHPARWIEEAKVDDVDKYFEVASMSEQRKDRILWLGCRIASHGRWIRYSPEDDTFSVTPEFAEDVESGELADMEEGGMDVDSEGSNATLGA